MSFKIAITSTLIGAFGIAIGHIVAALDQHPLGTLGLIGLVLAIGVAVAIARQNGRGGGGQAAVPAPTKPARRKTS